MRSDDINYFSIGPRLTLTFAVLIALILGGNTLVIWQFRVARLQTDRLTGISQQVIAVLRLQQSLRSFHQRMDEFAQSQDAARLTAGTDLLRQTLLGQIHQTRNALTHLPSGTHIDPAFLPTLEAIEIALPSQLEAVTALAASGDWEAIRLRLANEFKSLETQTAVLVNSIDQEVSGEMIEAVANMRNVHRDILLVVPTTAISTFLIAAFFGWAISRRIVELRLKERVNERMRMARELHDTLLQGMISASLQLHHAVDKFPEGSPAGPEFTRVLEIMGQVIEEGRRAVRGFRSIERENEGLEQAFARVPEQLDLQHQVDFRVIVEGHPQSLDPIALHEVYSIGREALVNSFRHSGASEIEVALVYSPSQLRVVVRDDGCGIDPQILQSGRDGHWGLTGMRERADKIGAQLSVLSRVGLGTQVELCVSRNAATESHPSGFASRWRAGLYRRRAAKAEPQPKRADQ